VRKEGCPADLAGVGHIGLSLANLAEAPHLPTMGSPGNTVDVLGERLVAQLRALLEQQGAFHKGLVEVAPVARGG